ncbi:hypothetical protein ACJQWK_01384 [Exserohilum turcicum]
MDGNTYFGNGPTTEVCVFAGACRVWTQGNCRISFCNNEQYDSCDVNNTWGDRARAIESRCRPVDQGGFQSKPAPQDWTEVAIRLNTDWRVSPKLAPGEIDYEDMSVEENAAELRRLDLIEEALSSGTDAANLEEREVHSLKKKQDDEFIIEATYRGTYRPGSAVFVISTNAQDSYTVTESKTTTIGVSTSVSVGASFWDLITAEIGVTVSTEYSLTSSTSIQVNIDCEDGQRAFIYWRPFFDRYDGRFRSNGQTVTVWVPKDTQSSRMNYDYQCAG